MARAGLLLTLVMLCVAAPVAAQQAQPAAGSIALGGSVGFWVPREGLNVGVTGEAFGQFYASARLGVRAFAALASADETAGDGSVRQARVAADLLYNWESGLWHPFVAGGVGVYRTRHAGTPDDSVETKIGPHVGGGAEYFARPWLSVVFEARYHFVAHDNPGRDPSGLTLLAGLKKYF